ncbi:hypothetical protein HHK36_018904 [Tetracentron sinense]|uniref:Uncharacterized protein n=1 Tax=Tetracentron sinense TaxID=13715 RepID=A0A834YWQ2_TETSI|nr:hypothetical protein HHK36_018904 [Tetracentron sinense]
MLLYLLMSLISKTPLTDAILLKRDKVDRFDFDPRNTTKLEEESDGDSNVKVFKVKQMVNKSNNKVVYAEARVDFVDFVLSFLTFPLGSIVELFGGNSPMQSLNTLYKSVEELSVENYIKSEECKNTLLHPMLPSYFSCENQLLPIDEVVNLYYYTFNCTECYTMSSAISLLDSLSVPISDVEERVVTVSKKEALTLLKFSLASKSVLTNTFIFNFSPKVPKQEN